MMEFELGLNVLYRLLALAVAAAMAVLVIRDDDWRRQLFAAIVFVPFVLRAAGLK